MGFFCCCCSFVLLLDIYSFAFACYMLGNTYEPKSMASFPCYETWNSKPSLTDLVIHMYFITSAQIFILCFPLLWEVLCIVWVAEAQHLNKDYEKTRLCSAPLGTSPWTSHRQCLEKGTGVWRLCYSPFPARTGRHTIQRSQQSHLTKIPL